MNNPINPEPLLRRFLRYVAIDTQSDPRVTDAFPSTSKQLVLCNLLLEELRALGVEAAMDRHGYVMARIPSNVDGQVPTIGFLAHVDTSPDAPGAPVKPRVIERYPGGEIVLNPELGICLSPEAMPELSAYVGQILVVTDGTTLLGADDKAGIAAIMAAVEHICTHPNFKHGPLRIGFTLDEEVGRGVDHFDLARFGADFAYTVDGGRLGDLEYENFNAALATVRVQGYNLHPGYAKGRMRNALTLGMEFHALIPGAERPEQTEGYQGFFHLQRMEGDVGLATLSYLVRDHDRTRFEERKALLNGIASELNGRYGAGTIRVELQDQYYNMRERLESAFHVVETAIRAMELVGVTPRVKPIRGGTDGARLSHMGLPCPNLFAGGENFHSHHEFVALPSMVKAAEVILQIVALYAAKGGD